MSTLEKILKKYNLPTGADKIEIPNVGRDDLAAMCAELHFKFGVEIGVAEGHFSEVICKSNPDMIVTGVDQWKPYFGYLDYQRESTYKRMLSHTLERMKPYGNYNILKTSSMDGATKFADNSVDFIYIDANHDYDHVIEDITAWYKKLRPGGIISGHDYYTSRATNKTKVEVKRAVHEFMDKNEIKPLIIWGTNAEVPGQKRDEQLSWSFIKP